MNEQNRPLHENDEQESPFNENKEQVQPLSENTEPVQPTSEFKEHVHPLSEHNEQQPFNGPVSPNREEIRETRLKVDKKPRGGKQFLYLVAASILGSALTLGAVSLTDEEIETSGEAEIVTQPANTVASNTTSSGENASLADMVEKASKSIVGIVNYQNQNNPFSGSEATVESGSGSGVIYNITDDATYIVTNNHVIEGASQVEVSLYDGEKVSAEVVGADALTDLAVLKLDGQYGSDSLEFGDSDGMRPGDQVIAIGNPLGLELSRTVTQGIISATDREISVETSAGEWELTVLQTDAAINAGNSGGALLNASGQLIGINSLKIAEDGVEGLSFAIPSNEVVPVINELTEKGKIDRPYIGVSLTDVDEIPGFYLDSLPKDVKSGTVVAFVEANTGAAKAGLQQMDVIVAVNGEPVEDSSSLRKYMYSNLEAGDTATLTLYRDGKKMDVEVTLSQQAAAE